MLTLRITDHNIDVHIITFLIGRLERSRHIFCGCSLDFRVTRGKILAVWREALGGEGVQVLASLLGLGQGVVMDG